MPLFLFYRFLSDQLSRNLPGRSSANLQGWQNYGRSEIRFQFLKELCHGNQFLYMASSTQLSSGAIRQMAVAYERSSACGSLNAGCSSSSEWRSLDAGG